ncbi:MAG TPA: GntR family transcriptional regulator [Acidobacteriaceae bacterium]|jgi:DNA-binding GntR family transcriptional regulator
MLTKLDRLPTQSSLTELAHHTIKRYILEGNFDSESRLTEDFFAQRLGISKSPVREALNTLQSEGLLRIEPRKGTYLRRYSAKEIEDLYQLREALEVFAAGAVKITPKLIRELTDSVTRIVQFLERNEKPLYIDEDIHFHETIVAGTGNSELCRMHSNIQTKLWLCRCQTYPLTALDTPASHSQITEALRKGDRALAQEVTRKHIHLVRDTLLRTLSETAPASNSIPWQ